MGFTELIIFGATLLAFTVQTVLGFAAGLVALPVLLFALPIPSAVAVLTIFNFVFSCIQVSKNRRDIDLEIYRLLGPGTVLGVIVGVALLSYGNPTILKKFLGVFILVYIAYRYSKQPKIEPRATAAALLSFVGGFFAGLFSTGAPPYVIYISSKYSDPVKLRANLIGILAVTNVVRFVLLVGNGILNIDIATQALWGAPAFIFAILFGQRLFERMDKAKFIHLVMFFLAISGVLLLMK